MKAQSLLFLFLCSLQAGLYAQLPSPDSLYLAAKWQPGQKAIYQMERFKQFKGGELERCISDKHEVSFLIKDQKEDSYQVVFQVDSTLQLMPDATQEDKLFNDIFTRLSFEFTTESYGAFRRLTNNEEIYRQVQSFFDEEADEGKGQANLALLQKIYSSPEEAQNLLLDYIGDLYSVYGLTLPLDEEICWIEERPNIVSGEVIPVDACEILTDWGPENKIVRYSYRAVIGREAATRTILNTMRQTAQESMGKEKAAEMDRAMKDVSYEIRDTGAMVIHYPSGWIMESFWQQNIITYEKGRAPFEELTGAQFKILGIEQAATDPDEELVALIEKVEELPRFPGCEGLSDPALKKPCADRKLLEFIYGNIRYPKPARRRGVQGICVVSFVVEKDGSLSNIRLTRDIGAGCGEEVLRVVQLMNDKKLRWIPGRKYGKAVRVEFNLPVKFRLE